MAGHAQGHVAPATDVPPLSVLILFPLWVALTRERSLSLSENGLFRLKAA